MVPPFANPRKKLFMLILLLKISGDVYSEEVCINNIIFIQLVINELITCFTRKSDVIFMFYCAKHNNAYAIEWRTYNEKWNFNDCSVVTLINEFIYFYRSLSFCHVTAISSSCMPDMHCKYSFAYIVCNLRCVLRMLWRECYFIPPILTARGLSFYRKACQNNIFKLKIWR